MLSHLHTCVSLSQIEGLEEDREALRMLKDNEQRKVSSLERTVFELETEVNQAQEREVTKAVT